MWSEAARLASIEARRAAKGARDMEKRVVRGAHHFEQRVAHAAHQSNVVKALNKDRFVHLVPPGSFRDHAIKEAAHLTEKGLEKVGAGLVAGPLGVGGVLAARGAYSALQKWKQYRRAATHPASPGRGRKKH